MISLLRLSSRWFVVCAAALAVVATSTALAQTFTQYDLIVAKAAVSSDVTVVDGTGITFPDMPPSPSR